MSRRAAFVALLVALGGGCAATGSDAGRAAALVIAGNANLMQTTRQAGGFFIETWFRPAPPDAVTRPRLLRVYIEGDGRGWRTRTKRSSDPTPVDPVGLRLAAADPFADDVLYLARPCQFVAPPTALCEPSLWTSARFSRVVVDALDAVIDQVGVERGADRIVLTGYSGGGVVAALIAAKRDDVAYLITIAAPLDHAAWTAHHGVSPLRDSLSPLDFLTGLRDIGQTHFVGEADDIVPAEIVGSYLDALATGTTAHLHAVAGFDHSCCWSEHWADLARRVVAPPVSPAVRTETLR